MESGSKPVRRVDAVTPVLGGGRGSRSAEEVRALQRTLGNTTTFRLLQQDAHQQGAYRHHGHCDPQPARETTVQRIQDVSAEGFTTAHTGDDRGPHFLSQSLEPRAVIGGGWTDEPVDIRQRVRYASERVDPAMAGLRVADDGTLAVHDVPEPKEFYATQEVVARANDALAQVNSPLRLGSQGRSLTIGQGAALQRVQPVLAQEPMQEPTDAFVNLVRSTCITLACKLIGSQHDKRSGVRLADGTGFDINPNATSDPRVQNLAGRIAQTHDGGLTPEAALTAAGDLASRAGLDDLGLSYGEAIRDGGRRGTAETLGINEFATPDVGEGYGIFSMNALTELDHAVAPPQDRGEDVWGYHFAAVVASSLDGSCRVTLENYARNEFDTVLREQVFQTLYQEAMGKKSWMTNLVDLEDGDDLMKLKDKFDKVARVLCNSAAMKETLGRPRSRLQNDFNQHTGTTWFFRVYGGGPGESFHEQQHGSGFFNNPMTLRVRAPAPPQ
ncbi:hypothetical protein ABT025_10705 [Streptomyces sp. NPDC002809]|uniref:hypothetical protein n=1 Tax=Streptomyces sp. NPDC002809 TaxID=3154433 RepID=UPI00332D7983